MVGAPAPYPSSSAGALFQYVRQHEVATRSDLVRLSGLSRSAVGQRVDDLLATGLVIEDGEAPSTGGRPPTRLRFEPRAGVVLAADLDTTHTVAAVLDLAGRVLANIAFDLDISLGPERVLSFVDQRFIELLDGIQALPDDVCGVGLGLPGPVEHETGVAVSPPIMPGWDGYPVPNFFADRYSVPVLVDNDVNIMALGEYRAHWRTEVSDLLFIKFATGIGCGIVSGGRIHRGAQGAAGDFGHIRVSGHGDVVCRCGNTGCVEAVAGGHAIAMQLQALGHQTAHARDVARLVQECNRDATRVVREGGRLLGEVLAAAVNLLNPAVIVIGGELATAHEQLLAGVREIVYKRSLPLATRHLRIVPSQLGPYAGIRGAAAMVLDEVLSPLAIDTLIGARHNESGPALAASSAGGMA